MAMSRNYAETMVNDENAISRTARVKTGSSLSTTNSLLKPESQSTIRKSQKVFEHGVGSDAVKTPKSTNDARGRRRALGDISNRKEPSLVNSTKPLKASTQNSANVNIKNNSSNNNFKAKSYNGGSALNKRVSFRSPSKCKGTTPITKKGPSRMALTPGLTAKDKNVRFKQSPFQDTKSSFSSNFGSTPNRKTSLVVGTPMPLQTSQNSDCMSSELWEHSIDQIEGSREATKSLNDNSDDDISEVEFPAGRLYDGTVNDMSPLCSFDLGHDGLDAQYDVCTSNFDKDEKNRQEDEDRKWEESLNLLAEQDMKDIMDAFSADLVMSSRDSWYHHHGDDCGLTNEIYSVFRSDNCDDSVSL